MGFGQEMEGCGKVMKYSMFVSNFISLIGGFAVAGIGAWTLVDSSFLEELLGSNMYMGAVYILIGTGSVVICIAFLGCMGAIKEIKCMLLIYFIIVFLLFVTMLIGGILGFVFREHVRRGMDSKLNSSLKMYKKDVSVQAAWDATQNQFECCGVKNFTEWKQDVPKSCCKIGPDGKKFPCDLPRKANTNTTFNKGCLEEVEVFLHKHAAYLGAAGVGVSSLMILGMVFSCGLFKLIK